MPRGKYRSKEQREKVLAKVVEVYHRKDMTQAEKIEYCGANSASDYKHLVKEAKLSTDYVDIWAPHKEEISAVVSEAIDKEVSPITHLRLAHSELYEKLFNDVAQGNRKVLERAIHRFSGYEAAKGKNVPKRSDYWESKKPAMLRVIASQRSSKLTFMEALELPEHSELCLELKQKYSDARILDALRKLSQKEAGGFLHKSRQSDFWSAERDLMEKVASIKGSEDEKRGVIKILSDDFASDLERLLKEKSLASINHAFQSYFLRIQNEFQGVRDDLGSSTSRQSAYWKSKKSLMDKVEKKIAEAKVRDQRFGVISILKDHYPSEFQQLIQDGKKESAINGAFQSYYKSKAKEMKYGV